jgi:hypothetical protein
MSGDSEQVTSLIWELLILNRAEGAPAFQPPTVKDSKHGSPKGRESGKNSYRLLAHDRKQA